MSNLVFEVSLPDTADVQAFHKLVADQISQGAQVIIQDDNWKAMDDYPPVVLQGKLRVV